MSHTIFASFAKDYHGLILHKSDMVDWNGYKCTITAIKRGGNLEILCPRLPNKYYGVKSNRVTLIQE